MTNAVASSDRTPFYRRITDNLTQQMASGALRSGDRVPSLRQLSRQLRVSLTTTLQAYLWLETRGYLESRPRSGFFVRTPFSRAIPVPRSETRKAAPAEVSTDAVFLDIIKEAADPSNVPLGVASANPEL